MSGSTGVPFCRLYERCLETSFVISNIFTVALPPKTFLRFSSALILRLFVGSWRLFFFIYTQSALTTSDRGIGPAPTTAAKSALTLSGFMNAEFDFAIYFYYYLIKDNLIIALKMLVCPSRRITPATETSD